MRIKSGKEVRLGKQHPLFQATPDSQCSAAACRAVMPGGIRLQIADVTDKLLETSDCQMKGLLSVPIITTSPKGCIQHVPCP